jgi:hypothetical protein
MSRLVEIISSSTGKHFLLFGLDDSSLSSFYLQLWITKYGIRMTDWVQAMGLNWISFMNSDIWVHNDETVARCNLFEEKRDCIVGVVINEDPLKIKLLDSLDIHSTDKWEVQSITIPASLNYPNGMYSKIPKERFIARDGTWRAEFLRNMKTNSSTASVIDAINGEPLRGTECYMLLKNTSNDQVKLFKLSVNMTKSKV